MWFKLRNVSLLKLTVYRSSIELFFKLFCYRNLKTKLSTLLIICGTANIFKSYYASEVLWFFSKSNKLKIDYYFYVLVAMQYKVLTIQNLHF